MKTVLLTKPGFRQGGFSRGLLVLLLAIDTVVREQSVPGCPARVTITAGSNGHTSGGHVSPRFEACDVRSKDFAPGADKRLFVETVLLEAQAFVGGGTILRTWDDGRQMVTEDFFGWFEDEKLPNEHFHYQVRKGHTIDL